MDTRIITADELDFVRDIFKEDPTIEKKPLTNDEIETYISHFRDGIISNQTLISMSFIDEKPVVMDVVYLYPQTGTCYFSLVKTIKRNVHYKTSAKLMAPAFDILAQRLQEMGYFKVLMTATERNHNIRNLIMSECSEYLGQYDWYDEFVIPQNQISSVLLYDRYRFSTSEQTVVVRMFSLKQEYRKKLLERYKDE